MGWPERIFVDDVFLFGSAFSVLVLVAILLASRLSRDLPSRAPRGARTRLTGFHVGLLTFVAIIASRALVVDDIVGASFLYADEQLDSCICPLQRKLELPVWNGNSNYIHFSLSRLVLDSLGHEPKALRAFQAFRFALAAGLFVGLLWARFHRWAVLGVAGLLVVSYPFIWHSVWSTAVGSGALPALVSFAILLRRDSVGNPAAILLGGLLGASIYVYPGATLGIGAALVFHVVMYRERWRVGALVRVACSVLATKWLLDVAYQVPFLGLGYGGGRPSLAYALEAWRVTPRDFFYRSESWGLVNFGGPYFEPFLFWALGLALVSRTRFFWFCLAAFALNVLLVATTGPHPGARRAMWALPLLYLGCLEGSLRLVATRRRLAAGVKIALLVSLVCVAARYPVLEAHRLPLSYFDPFFTAARAFLADHAPLEEEVALFQGGNFESRQYWCALAFTRGLWRDREVPTLVAKGTSNSTLVPSRRGVLLLMQSQDAPSDVTRAFGPGAWERVSPPAIPDAEWLADPNPHPLRVQRLPPASTEER